MAQNSDIEWTHHTENPIWGCVNVHEGCDNCYAEALANRWNKKLWGNDKPRMETKNWAKNLIKYDKLAKEAGEMHRVFIGSMMDIFEKPMPVVNHKWESVNYDSGDIRRKLFEEIVPITPNLIYLFLTKRTSNIKKYIPKQWIDNPPENVMFGTSISNQETADTLLPHLAALKGNLFISLEPMLGEVNLDKINGHDDAIIKNIDWVIVGGESGNKKRPFNSDWARSIKRQCEKYGVSFFMKQIDKVQPIPNDLMVREFPKI